MGTVILNIVIVLGIIIAGGFVIFFLGDLLMSIFNPKKDEKTIANKKEKENERINAKLKELSPESAEKVKGLETDVVYDGVVVEDYNPDEDQESETTEEEQVEETEEQEDEEARNAYIEERRRELMERLARMNEESDDDEEDEEEETDEDEEDEEDEEVVDADAVEEETEEDDDSTDELERARRELEEVKAKNETLVSELNMARAEAAKQQNVIKTTEVFLTEEDYEARLALEEERLKVNEKELRACKKEYIPLRRIKTSLERDEKKLRRKEALVAKQKLVLYGVNNYSDIDEEKAKKLAEDLDHYDGLKLSVEHGEEVMTKNAERYPLLEKMYEILVSQNEQIKANIERTKEELEKLRAKKED